MELDFSWSESELSNFPKSDFGAKILYATCFQGVPTKEVEVERKQTGS